MLLFDWFYDFVKVPIMVVTIISTRDWPQEENIKTFSNNLCPT